VKSSAGPSPPDITALLHGWSEGDPRALGALLPLVYRELRRIAAGQLQRERPGHSIDSTGLVHELYVRLVDQRASTVSGRAHFYRLAAQLMRRILVDHARERRAGKRGGGATLVLLDDNVADPNAASSTTAGMADVIDVDRALERLAVQDPDHARLVELRFFAGLTIDEAAQVLNRSARTVKREWRLARAWLYRELRMDA
jgi:RNA polymerase sigma-70 factor, ECF subfamily